MKKIIVLFLLASSFSFGQYVTHSNLPANFENRFPTDGVAQKNLANKVNINGTPYAENQYTNGKVTIVNKTSFTAPMRYNSAKGVIEFLDDDEKTKELLRRPYITATFAGKTYEVLPYLKEDTERLAYFNRLNSGETQLLFKPKRKLKIGSQRF